MNICEKKMYEMYDCTFGQEKEENHAPALADHAIRDLWPAWPEPDQKST